jgi:hypothetical protein
MPTYTVHTYYTHAKVDVREQVALTHASVLVKILLSLLIVADILHRFVGYSTVGSTTLALLQFGTVHYGQQLCQNPRSIQKYYAYVLVLLTLFLAVFPTGDRIQ